MNDSNPYEAMGSQGGGAMALDEPVELAFWQDGWRIAGVCLLVNAVLVVAEMLALAATSSSGPPRGVLGVVFDVLIGLSLLRGEAKYRVWAIVRTVLGAILIVGTGVASADACTPLMAMIGFGGLLTMLIGRPSVVRAWLGAALFAVYAALEVLGLVVVALFGAES